jgi:hypothetical protein
MNKIKFFYQERCDGGARTGIGINDLLVLHRFVPGSAEHDPALLWYMDVVFEGLSLPEEPDNARQWLQSQSHTIKRSLDQTAKHLEIGLDISEEWPFRQEIAGTSQSVLGNVFVSGVRRLSEGELAEKIRSVANNWDTILQELAPFVEV